MLLTKNRIGGVLLLAFCGAYAWLIQDIRLLPFQRAASFNARTMPEVLAMLGIGLSLWCILVPGTGERPQLRGLDWPRGLAFLGLMSAYGLLLRPLGFLLSTSLFLIAGYLLLGERRPFWLLIASVPLVVAFWALMDRGLGVYVAALPAALGR